MNRLIIKARSIARRIGLTRLYYRFSPRGQYEENFHRAILSGVHDGEVAWDIGANRGFYTKIFCEKTGTNGHVFAFEPGPESYAELCQLMAGYPCIRVERMALSDFDGTGRLVILESHTQQHLQWDTTEATSAKSVEIPVVRGDSYWAISGITPNVIKIDVEGFEEEVLAGMDGLLSCPELRRVFIELHFQLLEKRGRGEAPLRIEQLLRRKGLQPKWVDSNHIAAERIKVF